MAHGVSMDNPGFLEAGSTGEHIPACTEAAKTG